MTPSSPLSISQISTAEYESLSSGSKPEKSRWSIIRSILFTAFVSLIVLISLFYGQDVDSNLSVFFSAHLVLLTLFTASSLVLTLTRRSFSDESLFLFIILDALFLAYYSYLMTIHYFAILFPAYIQIIAILIALGSTFLLFTGFALASR